MNWFGRNKKEEKPSTPPLTAVPPNALSPVPYQMREFLFGDRPMSEWPPSGSALNVQPWIAFDQARKLYAAGKKQDAMKLWMQIAQAKGFEP